MAITQRTPPDSANRGGFGQLAVDYAERSAVRAARRTANYFFTTRSASQSRRRDLLAAGAEFIETGQDEVDLDAVMIVLAERQLLRVHCEGGAVLLRSLVTADLIDAMCLSVAPLLVGGGVGLSTGLPPQTPPRTMQLASVIVEAGYLMARFTKMA